MKFLIDSRYLIAVQAACANKLDVRTYIQGWYVDAERQVIVGTNGAFILIAPINVIDDQDPPDGVVFKTSRELRYKTEQTLYVDTVALQVTSDSAHSKPAGLKTIEGRFPDWHEMYQRSVSTVHAKLDSISFDVDKLHGVATILDCPPVFTFGKSDRSAMQVTFGKHPELRALLMPCVP